MNSRNFPLLTPLVRVISQGDESILCNLVNGKWIRVSNPVLGCLSSATVGEVKSRLVELASDNDAEEFVNILSELGFIRADKGKVYSDKIEFTLKSAYLNVTNRCNLACCHCYFGSNPKLSHGLPNAEICRMVDSIYDAGIRYLIISGGEPLYRPEIGDLMRFIRGKGFKEITLLTNGTLIDSLEIATLIDQCVDHVHVSLDGPDEDSNAVLRGKGNFNRAVTGIKNLKSAGVKSIQVVLTITSANIGRMRDMFSLCEDLGVELGTTVFCDVGRGRKYSYLKPNITDLTELFQKEVQLSDCNPSVTDPSVININAGVTCGCGTLMVSVNCYGNVYPCHLLHRPRLLIGNLIACPNLLELMATSTVAADFKLRHVENRKCHGCKVEYFCKGGCLAHTIDENRRLKKPWAECDPFCEANKQSIGSQIWPNS